MKHHIRWTTREWEELAQFCLENGIDPDRYGFTREFGKVQKSVLPSERWRSLEGGAAVSIKRMLKGQIQLLKLKIPSQPVAVQYVPPPPGPEDLSTEDLLVEVARRLAKLLEPSKSQAEVLEQVRFLERKFEEARIIDHGFHKCPNDKAPEKVHKPRILVCGPNGDTSRALMSAFPGVDLRFVEYGDNPQLVRGRAQGCSAILCITKFVHHSITEAAKATGLPCVLVSTVREAREWLARVQA